MRRLIAAACLLTVALSGGCSRDVEPNSLFDEAGYHVRGTTVYYLNAFPGRAFQIDRTYARDGEHVNGQLLADAQAGSFELMDRPGFSKDSGPVYQHDQPISTDPAHFELLEDDLAKDSTAVYRSDGTVLSHDPQNFVVISDVDHYLYAKDSRTVYVNGNPIPGAAPTPFLVLHGAYSRDEERAFYFAKRISQADVSTFAPLVGPYAIDAQHVYWMSQVIGGAEPATFRVLNANFECSTDGTRAFYRWVEITGADPTSFPPGKPATGCSDTTISFGE